MPTATPGLETLEPAQRFNVLLMQNSIIANAWPPNVPVPETEVTRLRGEWAFCVSELGPRRARQLLIEFATLWPVATGRCSFCASPAHIDGVMSCPTLPANQDARDA